MAIDVVIPKMGMTMESGTLVTWLVPDGAEVAVGQPLFHLVTEKLDCEVEAEAAGVLVQLVGPDTTLEPGGLVGRLLAQGETGPASPAPAPAGSSDGAATGGARRAISPNARRLAAELGVELTTLIGTGPAGRIVGRDVVQAAGSPTATGRPAGGERRAVSPLARRLAGELGVDLSTVVGTGPGGRITRTDVEAAAAATPAPPAAPAAPTAPASPTAPAAPAEGDGEVRERIRLIGMRGTIAKRMHASLQEMAQLTLHAEVDMTRAVKLRKRLAAQWEADDRRPPSYTDLVIKAVAHALVEHPALNARIAGDHLERLADVHVGLAVALDEGLVVPVLRHTDRLSVSEISDRARALATAARDNRLGLDDLAGSTFSVTALGAFGIDGFTPVINPPNVAILGVGRVRDVAVPVSRRRVERRRQLTLSLTFDHRAVDGAPAARFLAAVTERLESPLRLLA
ncbi:MAG: dihydrolipoamide acetyltransferase family protein [Acidimicrobiales bacterium]